MRTPGAARPSSSPRSSGARGRRPAARLYHKLFRLNDRQGELFFYMHEQMLARYDAELLSNDLARVEPFDPSAGPSRSPTGHDPIGLQGYGRARSEIARRRAAMPLLQSAGPRDRRGAGGGRAAAPDGGTSRSTATTSATRSRPRCRSFAISTQTATGGLHSIGMGSSPALDRAGRAL